MWLQPFPREMFLTIVLFLEYSRKRMATCFHRHAFSLCEYPSFKPHITSQQIVLQDWDSTQCYTPFYALQGSKQAFPGLRIVVFSLLSLKQVFGMLHIKTLLFFINFNGQWVVWRIFRFRDWYSLTLTFLSMLNALQCSALECGKQSWILINLVLHLILWIVSSHLFNNSKYVVAVHLLQW